MKTPEEIKKGLVEAVAEMFWATKYGDDNDMRRACGMAHTSMADALAYIQQLESLVPRWIPVEERLPEDDEMYLVYTTEHTCAVYRYWGDGEWETEWGEDASHDITHWMPLPEPPKEGKE